MATRILQLNGGLRPLVEKWINKVIRGHPRIRSVVGRPIKAARISGTHPDLTREFYQSFQEVVRQYIVQPCNESNMDKHGIALGVSVDSTVIMYHPLRIENSKAEIEA